MATDARAILRVEAAAVLRGMHVRGVMHVDGKQGVETITRGSDGVTEVVCARNYLLRCMAWNLSGNLRRSQIGHHHEQRMRDPNGEESGWTKSSGQ